MSAHTPGPWFYKPFGRGSLSYVVTADLNDARSDVCNVIGISSVPGRVEANARFIAAAPHMREVLAAVRLAIEGHSQMRGILAQIDAAIAAAEGK